MTSATSFSPDAAAASAVPAVRQHDQAEQESSHTDLQP